MKFAIVGCGVIARIHAESIRAIEGAELYAACDIIPDKADSFAQTWDVPNVFYNADEVMADPEVDIVCVCVPSGTHSEICIAAAHAGKAIVCEKPMEITPERIENVISEVEKSGVTMQCIFQRRMMPVAQAVREAVAAGKLGRICTAHADLKYYRSQEYYDSAGWRGTWELDGGGALMNQGVHGVDLILWMVGGKMKTLYGRAETLARNISVEDTAAAIIQMEDGALITIDSATTAYPGFNTTFEIHGEKGSVVFSDQGLETWEFLDPEDAPPRPDSGEAVGGGKSNTDISHSGHVLLLQNAMEAVRDGKSVLIPPTEARDAVRVICGIYESTRTNAVIQMSKGEA